MSDYNPSEYVTVPDGWSCKRLADCTIDGNISYGIVQPGQHDDNGIPVIRINNVNNGRLDLTDVLKVSPEIEKKYERTRLKGGEVLLTLVGSTGQSFVVPNELVGWNVPRAIAVIRVDEEIGADWINICLQSKETVHFLNVRANTTVQKTLNLKDVRDIPILIPPIEVKKSIEGMALSLFDKIKLNRQTNQTLEHIAQAIFKSWFVDFEPTRAKIAAKQIAQARQDSERSAALSAALLADGRWPEAVAAAIAEGDPERAAMAAISGKSLDELGQLSPEQQEQLLTTAALFPDALVDSELGEIPEGWDIESVGNHVNVTKGRSYKSVELEESNTALVTLKSFMRGGGYREDGLKEYTGTYKPEQIIEPGELVMSLTDVTQAAEIVGKPAIVTRNNAYEALVASLDVAILRPNESAMKEFFYGLMSTYRFHRYAESFATGTTVLHLNAKGITSFEFAQPDIQLCKIYADIIGPMLAKHEGNIHLSRSLEQLRDSLLPKLLSGELKASPNQTELDKTA